MIYDQRTELMQCIQVAETDFKDFSKRHFNGLRENIVNFLFHRSIDLANGMLTVTEIPLIESSHVLARAMFEIIVQLSWVLVSDDNSRKFAEAHIADIRRNAKDNLRKGYATVTDGEAKVDITSECLTSDAVQNIPKLLTMKEMAKEAGLEPLYTMLYGVLSMFAHGLSYIPNPTNDMKNEEIEIVSVNLELAVALLTSIHEISATWIIKRKRIPFDEVNAIKGLVSLEI